jgi:hypothetical protein
MTTISSLYRTYIMMSPARNTCDSAAAAKTNKQTKTLPKLPILMIQLQQI